MYSLILGSKVDSNFDELKKYIDIYYQECLRDINKSGYNCLSTKRIEAKWCVQEDFGNTTEAIKYFESLKG